jgi:hypothetical protein
MLLFAVAGPSIADDAFDDARAAAEQGDAIAQDRIGGMYQHGKGVPQNYVEAVRWYRASAEQGFEWGQSNLGVMYGLGLGVPQNFVLAHMWLNLSVGQGYKEAEKGREAVAGMMTSAQIAEAQRLAQKWKPNAN